MALKSAAQIGLLAAALLALAGCGSEPAAPPAAPPVPVGEQLKLAPTNITDSKAVSAEITSRDQAEARARIAGTLVSLTVRAGDQVSRGQAIGKVADSRLGYETTALGAQAAAAEAEAVRARAELARIEDLYRNKVYARARLDSAVAAARAADAQVAASRAQQSASASVVAQGAVLAPATGKVLRADVPAGSVVSPGQSIATITAGPPVLRLMLPESLASQVRIGAIVTLDEPVEGSRSGQIVQIYPAISGGQLMVDASVPGLSESFIGRRVGASIETGRRDAIVVPRRFVSTRFGVDFVDVLSGKSISAVPVQIAPLPDGEKLEILSGVRAGDTLFVAKGAAR